MTDLELLRYMIGDSDLPYILSDDILNFLLAKYPSPDFSQEVRVYLAGLEALKYMKSKYAQSAFRAREREGALEVEEYGAERYQAICDLIDYWEANPPSDLGIGPVLPIIGGVVASENRRVRRDPESVNGGYSLGETKPQSFSDRINDFWLNRRC